MTSHEDVLKRALARVLADTNGGEVRPVSELKRRRRLAWALEAMVLVVAIGVVWLAHR